MYVDDSRQAIHFYDLSKPMPRWFDTILFPSELMFGTNPTPYTPPQEHIPPNEISIRFPGAVGGRGGPPPVSAGAPSVRHEERPRCLEVSDDGTLLIVATDKKLRSYRVTTKPELVSEADIKKPAKIALHEDSQSVYIGNETGPIEVWKLKNGAFIDQPKTIELQIKHLTSMAVSPDGNFLAIGQGLGNSSGIARIHHGVPDDKLCLLPEVDQLTHAFGMEHNRAMMHFTSRFSMGKKLIVFDPSSKPSIAVANGKYLQTLSFNDEGQLQAEQPAGQQSERPLWSDERRQLIWTGDSSLAIASPRGISVLKPTTGEVISETLSLSYPVFSIDGNFVLITPTLGSNQSRAIIRPINDPSADTKIDTDGMSSTSQFLYSKAKKRWVVNEPNHQRLVVISSLGDTEAFHSALKPNNKLIGLDSSENVLMAEYEASDIGGQRCRLVAYPSHANRLGSPKIRHEFLIPAGRDGQFVASPDGETMVYQIDGEGAYKIVSGVSTDFSASSYGVIGYVSNNATFMLMRRTNESGADQILVVDPKTDDVMQFWSFSGTLESYSISKDERFIATANSDGSVGILDMLSPDQWPIRTELPDDSAYGNEDLARASTELEKLLAEASESILAFEQRVAATATEDEKNEVLCDEPHSEIIIRLLDFAEKYQHTDFEYQALHHAMAMSRITPPFVPEAPWNKKHNKWYAGSAKATEGLKSVARIYFSDLHLNDPRTASVLRPVITYWRSRQSQDLIVASEDIYRRSTDPQVQAVALLICAEANMDTQVRFLSSGHHITPPTEQQLTRAESLLKSLKKDYAELEIEGIGSIMQRAKELERSLEQVRQGLTNGDTE